MANLQLHKHEETDYETVCPMCGDKDSLSISFDDASGYTNREVHICQPCPCIWFDYYATEDTDRLAEILR